MPKQTKRAAITQARKDYTKLNSAYHKIGQKAFGKPTRSQIHRDYEMVKRARNAAGRKLGKLTGVR
jgi:hypothetical protein